MEDWNLERPDQDNILTTRDAYLLIKTPKRCTDTATRYISHGNQFSIPLVSHDARENFFLDFQMGSYSVYYSSNHRVRSQIILARIDVGCSHRNPRDMNVVLNPMDPFYHLHDSVIGKEFNKEPHIHLYREGYGDRWAYPLPMEFTNTNNVLQTLEQFMEYCNIVERPNIQMGLDRYV